MTVKAVPLQSKTADNIKEDLRTLTEMAERGEITDFVAVAAIKDDDGPAFMRVSSFDDRWRLLGALEYAKATAG